MDARTLKQAIVSGRQVDGPAVIAGLASAADWELIEPDEAWSKMEPLLDGLDVDTASEVVDQLISTATRVRSLAAEYAVMRRGEIAGKLGAGRASRARLVELTLGVHQGNPVPPAVLGMLSADAASWSRQSVGAVARHAATWGVAPGCEQFVACVDAVAVAAGICPVVDALERYSDPSELGTLVQVTPDAASLEAALQWLEGRDLLKLIRITHGLERLSHISTGSTLGTVVAMSGEADIVEWVLTRAALQLDEVDAFVSGMNRVADPQRLVVLCKDLEDTLIEHSGDRGPMLAALRRGVVAYTNRTGAAFLSGDGGLAAQRDAIALTGVLSAASVDVLCGLLESWPGTLRGCIEVAEAVCGDVSDNCEAA